MSREQLWVARSNVCFLWKQVNYVKRWVESCFDWLGEWHHCCFSILAVSGRQGGHFLHWTCCLLCWLSLLVLIRSGLRHGRILDPVPWAFGVCYTGMLVWLSFDRFHIMVSNLKWKRQQMRCPNLPRRKSWSLNSHHFKENQVSILQHFFPHACAMNIIESLIHACFMLVSCLFHACAAVWSPAAFGQICWGRSEAGRDFQPRAAPDVCAVQRRATAVLCAASTIPAAVPACVCWCRKSTASAVCDADASDASDAAIPCNVFGLLRWCLHGKSSLWTATASTVWTAATTGSAPATVRAVAIPTASSAASAATAERHGRRSLRTGPGHSFAIWLDSHAPSSTLCARDTCATTSWPISR